MNYPRLVPQRFNGGLRPTASVNRLSEHTRSNGVANIDETVSICDRVGFNPRLCGNSRRKELPSKKRCSQQRHPDTGPKFNGILCALIRDSAPAWNTSRDHRKGNEPEEAENRKDAEDNAGIHHCGAPNGEPDGSSPRRDIDPR
jgi:hypothetical protein